MTVTVVERPKPKIDRAVQDEIGRKLRAMYAELLRQPLPDKLIMPLRAANVKPPPQRLEDPALRCEARPAA